MNLYFTFYYFNVTTFYLLFIIFGLCKNFYNNKSVLKREETEDIICFPILSFKICPLQNLKMIMKSVLKYYNWKISFDKFRWGCKSMKIL